MSDVNPNIAPMLPAMPAPKREALGILPVLACAYAAIVSPLIDCAFPPTAKTITDAGIPNRLFWPAMAALTLVLVWRNASRLRSISYPPHIVFLAIYALFAGLSVVWAFKPEISLTRYVQQVMILTSIILPALLASRVDLLRGLFICFGLAAILNLAFVANNSAMIVEKQNGYPGYFASKNQLGEFAAIAFLLALHETSYRGSRRVQGLTILLVSTLLLFLSNSKTATGLAFLTPILAVAALGVTRFLRTSPAIVVMAIPLCYLAASLVLHLDLGRFGYFLYGDPTFTGRTTIWAFAKSEIAHRPILGWGYQSFWLVGPDAPSVVNAPGWVKNMPNSHNGYYDTMLELGYTGLFLLSLFVVATLHGVRKVAERRYARAHAALSIILYFLIYNFFESFWMRSFDVMWVVFVVVAADIARYCQPALRKAPLGGPSAPRAGQFGQQVRSPAQAPRSIIADAAPPGPGPVITSWGRG
jgi:O-antigen ligase